MRENKIVRIAYDPEAKACYIYLHSNDWMTAEKTVEIGNDDSVMADIDRGGRCFGVEILGCQEPYVQVYEGGREVRRPTRTVEVRDQIL